MRRSIKSFGRGEIETHQWFALGVRAVDSLFRRYGSAAAKTAARRLLTDEILEMPADGVTWRLGFFPKTIRAIVLSFYGTVTEKPDHGS